ncbi:DUF7405 family protein [Halapricum hydrolyticum]|uniref:Tat pathway signal protein n=1 Tax=Halapricum hydrolyticum TaxID=2979991 RepID=A0AAE3IA85_9EURY|nr:hypothetical protein [Halapricum hydrolyticum]MCU4717067.1 hypothetical protein [Halapricum hydrolyticum]MCU4725994.1 hypothetical protein [Halapricum hydrolyticum]
MSADDPRRPDRREFVKAAVAIGGTSALTACLERERRKLQTETASDEIEFPRGSPKTVPTGQHRWGEFLVRDAHGNTVPPQQLVVLGLRYEGSGRPTTDQREQVDDALGTLERAFQWGTGGDAGAAFNRGLLFTLAYSPSYFQTVGDVPDSLVPQSELVAAVDEDPASADTYDAIMLLASDVGAVVLAAEAALFGRTETVNGLAVEATFEGVFSRAGRHTGFIGKGMPADRLDEDRIPEDAPLSMGFKSGFRDNLPSEDRVTIPDGPFAGGTTVASSTLTIDLDRWYDQSHRERVAEMFCPAHDPEAVGETGAKLGADSGVTEDHAESVSEHAAEYGRVGHAQKTARARDEDFEPTILRRTEGIATDVADGVGFQFNSIQAHVEDFIETRRTMNPDEYDDDVAPENHGIADYLDTERRGIYLAPPRSDWALPEV